MKPAAFKVQPPKGPTVHAKPIRAPGKREPLWYWRCTVYEAGDERTVWSGRGTVDDVRAEVWQLIGRGEHLAPPPDEPDAVDCDTVAELLAFWRGDLVANRTDLAPHTIETYTSHSRVLEEVLGAVRLDLLGRRDLDRYRATVSRPPGECSRRRKPRGSASVHLDFVVLTLAWAWGRSVGACPDRDLDVPDIVSKPTRDKYTPTDGEVASVIRHLPVWAADLVTVQWAMGARVGEIGAVETTDVDLARNELALGRHERAEKTGERRVPIPKLARPILARRLAAAEPGARLWTESRDGMRKLVNVHIARACRAEGIPKWTTHGLRRAYVNAAARRKLDIATVATLTGHSVAVLMTYYRQVQDEDRIEVARAMERELPAGDVVDLAEARRRR